MQATPKGWVVRLSRWGPPLLLTRAELLGLKQAIDNYVANLPPEPEPNA